MLHSQSTDMMMRSDAQYTLQQQLEHVNGLGRSFLSLMTAIPLGYLISRYEQPLPCEP